MPGRSERRELTLHPTEGETYADEAVLGLELLSNINRVIDDGEASALATTELGLQAKDVDLVGIASLELLGKDALELLLGDVGAALVQDVDNLTRVSLPAWMKVITTICRLARRRLTMNFRVRTVTAGALSAIMGSLEELKATRTEEKDPERRRVETWRPPLVPDFIRPVTCLPCAAWQPQQLVPLRATLVFKSASHVPCALSHHRLREILSLYRQMLRAAQRVSGTDPAVTRKIRDTFRARAQHPRRDVDQITHWLHRGRSQLDLLKDTKVQRVSVFSAKDSTGGAKI